MDIREIQPSEVEAARAFLANNGWAQRVRDAGAFRELVQNSQRVYVAVEGAEIIGFARALCDGVSNGYLSMVVVAEAYRGKGIGRALVQAVTGNDARITWVLRAGRPGAAGFFKKLGFVVSRVSMERQRA
jgi:GNAT superfamily N-acetyltransferase